MFRDIVFSLSLKSKSQHNEYTKFENEKQKRHDSC